MCVCALYIRHLSLTVVSVVLFLFGFVLHFFSLVIRSFGLTSTVHTTHMCMGNVPSVSYPSD